MFETLDSEGAFHNEKIKKKDTLGETTRSEGSPVPFIKIDAAKAQPGTVNALEYTEVHEAFHGAGSVLSFTHTQMALAAYKVGTEQGLFSGLKRIKPLLGRDLANSFRFNRMLFTACPPR